MNQTTKPAGRARTSERWPADTVTRRPVADLAPYARNSRTHTTAQIAQIAESIREWGWTTPVLVDEEGGILAGHARVQAATLLGLEDVPVMVAAGWSEAQRRAYVIADNQLALEAGWDLDALGAELDEIGELGGLGFDLGGLALPATGSGGGGGDPDEDAPEPPVKPVSRLGDLWVCGEHRLLCGDSTSAEAVARLLDGAKPHLMVTDPPYGVEYDADWRNHAMVRDARTGVRKKVGGRAIGKVENDDKADWSAAWELFPGDVAYVWHGGLHAGVVAASLLKVGLGIRAQIIWAKSRIAISRGHYHWQHEPCWYAVREGGTGHWQGDRKQSTVWEIDKPQRSETGHSTQKPVDCMRIPMLNNSARGDAVYEPFCGSGTTMIAAEMERRRAYCMELSPAYVDVIVKRWQAFAGEDAVLEGTGETFAAVDTARYEATGAADDSLEGYGVALDEKRRLAKEAAA